MVRRGDILREHILWTAKDVFLEVGFERASMDVIANRAETSKRSLYAHFENKEKLYLAVIELVRGLFLNRLGTPDDYSDKPTEALVLFCGRYLEILLYKRSVQMMRLSMSESERFPEQGAQLFDVMFAQIHARLNTYFETRFALSPSASAEAAYRLHSLILYPQLLRALFGMNTLAENFHPETLNPDIDLTDVHQIVTSLILNISTPGN